MNIAIFVSGNGTNCENLIRYFNVDDKKDNVTLVVSNRPNAFALTRAKRLNVPTKVLSNKEFNDEKVILSLLQSYEIDFIVLAGFMQIIPDFLVEKYERHIVNIHPSLLPKYGGKGMYGNHVHQAVKNAGEHATGITIHFVSQECDAGEIIAQFFTYLTPTDTVEIIEEKVHQLEQEYFPTVVDLVIKKLQKKE